MCIDISTGVNIGLTVATFIMAIATCYMACSTHESVKEMKNSRKEANKPHIVFYFTLKEHSINFVVKNIGKTTAKNVLITSNPKLIALNEYKISLFDNKIPSFPPGFEIVTFFDQTFNLSDILKYEISITYEDMYGESNNEQYIMDFSFMEHTLLKSPPDKDVILNRINKNLVKINKSIQKLKNN